MMMIYFVIFTLVIIGAAGAFVYIMSSESRTDSAPAPNNSKVR
jgi:hypothetical protein